MSNSETVAEVVSNPLVDISAKAITTFGYQVLSLVGGQLQREQRKTESNNEIGQNGHASYPSGPAANCSNDKESRERRSSSTSIQQERNRLWFRRLSQSNESFIGTGMTESFEKLSINLLPRYTLEEVSYHETEEDCWVVIYDRVYDVTPFLYDHPGGAEVILEYAGRDATFAFRSAGHTSDAYVLLKPYLIGVIVDSQRIWYNLDESKD